MRGYGVILTTLLLALVLSVLPMPAEMAFYRPHWVALALIYWCMALPEKVGVGFAFLCGLLLDILTGTLLGQHAFGLSLVAYLTLKSYRRVRVFPLWQQAIFVAVLLLLERVLFFWVNGALGLPTSSPAAWTTPLIGGLLWPWTFIILRDLRRRFHTP